MSAPKPINIQMLRRILAELDKYGSVSELVRQLNLNTNLEERNRELQMLNDFLTRTRDSIQERIKECETQEREALKRRDDRGEQVPRRASQFEEEGTRGSRSQPS